MNKALLDRTSLWEIRPDINSLQVDNAREQAKLYYEANKEEICANILREKDKEINRLNNIIDKAKKETTKQLKGAITQEYTNLEKILNILELKEGNNENNNKENN